MGLRALITVEYANYGELEVIDVPLGLFFRHFIVYKSRHNS